MLLKLFLIQLIGLMSPGPDFFYIIRRAASSNSRNAIFAAIGISLGVAFWAIVAIFGLGLLGKSAEFVPYMVMILGGSFLTYIGYKMVRVRENAKFDESVYIAKTSALKEMKDGLMINLSNAKIVIFFSSVLSGFAPQFESSSDYVGALLILVFSSFFYFSLVALLFSRKFIRDFYAKYNRYIDNFAGVVFLFFGLKLIYTGIQYFI